jgi:hypothetical protein
MSRYKIPPASPPKCKDLSICGYLNIHLPVSKPVKEKHIEQYMEWINMGKEVSNKCPGLINKITIKGGMTS